MTYDTKARARELDNKIWALMMKHAPSWPATKTLPAIAAALDEARIAGMREAADIIRPRTEPTDCDRANYDASCNAWECSIEIRGGDCLCAGRMEQAEAIIVAIDARISELTAPPAEKEKQG